MKKDVCDWLREYLRNGPREVSEIRSAARSAGYTRGELREAKLVCLVRVTNNGCRGCTADKWFWSLPVDKL